MKKQKLEKILKKSITNNLNLLGFKLHNNPLAHQTTPADFIIHTKSNKVYYVECKECKRKSDGSIRFDFNRLTQETDLEILNSFNEIISCYVCISLQEKTFKKSKYYLIPFSEYKKIKESFIKNSLNEKDMIEYFKEFELLQISNEILNLNHLS